MKNEDIALLALSGVAVVLILKSGGLTLPGAAPRRPGGREAFSVYNPFKSAPSAAYNPANPGALVPTSEIVRGTIKEYYSGDTSGYSTPTNRQIIDSVLSETYGLNEPTSIVKLDGAYW